MASWVFDLKRSAVIICISPHVEVSKYSRQHTMKPCVLALTFRHLSQVGSGAYEMISKMTKYKLMLPWLQHPNIEITQTTICFVSDDATLFKNENHIHFQVN